MPAERYFIDTPLSQGETVSLEGQELHHLCHVMRNHKGDVVELVNGKGSLAEAVIENISKHACLLSVTKVEEKKSRAHLILAQAIPKLPRLEVILEKGTELGVAEFWLFPGALSEKKEFSENQMQRMHTLLISAMKQCGRLDLPALHLKPALAGWEKSVIPAYFGDTREGAPMISPGASLLFIGPESGFTSQEVNLLESKLHARGVKLHDNILRVDTAAIVGVYSLC